MEHATFRLEELRFGSRGWIGAATVIALMLLPGCSSFNREWKRAVAQPIPTTEITGPWEGEWRSEVNGHHGRLRGILTKWGEESYLARFHAIYWKIFRYTSTVVLDGKKTSDGVVFEGEANLGWWAGGTYQYKGEANPTNFSATYRSKYDHGVFQMKRPQKPL